jgi:heptosyltransferase-2
MRIAVFLPGWVGDVVMATPALRALRQHFPDAHLTGILKPYVAGALEGLPWLDSLLFLDRRGPWSQRWPGVAWQLRKHRPDLAVLFPNTFRTALAAWLGGCGRRVGYARYGRAWLLTDRLRPIRSPSGRRLPTPIIDDYNRLAETAGCPWPGYRMELATAPRDEEAADAVWRKAGFLPGREVVCLNPGGAFGSAKHWYADSFAPVARNLIDRRQSSILVLCGPKERDQARQIADATGRKEIATLADVPLSLGLLKACVRRSDLLITTDSGPRHFAAAFGRPVVTLFGPTHIAWTETHYAGAVHLQKKVDCGPCQKRVCPLDHRCMRGLTPAEVFAAAAELLARPPHGRRAC